VTGKTIGGLSLYHPNNCLDRETALRMWTEKVTWFSNEEGKKGRLAKGQLADFAVLDRDYFACPQDEIRDITSVLTVVGGRIVHGGAEFARLAPPLPPAMPDWSPVNRFGGYHARPERKEGVAAQFAGSTTCGVHGQAHTWARQVPVRDFRAFWGAIGCSCWAF
jgi:hypothetical protein